MNNQPPEKQVIGSDGTDPFLDYVSIFKTIQGEGPYSGKRAIFIRLAGCNLQCPGCDTNYTEGRRVVKSTTILKDVMDIAEPPYLIVITGGEPFRQNISPLVDMLLVIGYEVQIETNGTAGPIKPLNKKAVVICSPKTGSVNPLIRKHIAAFKYVVSADEIRLGLVVPVRALGHTVKPHLALPTNEKIPVYIQPEDTKNEEQNVKNLHAAMDLAFKYGYTLQVQLHKILGVE